MTKLNARNFQRIPAARWLACVVAAAWFAGGSAACAQAGSETPAPPADSVATPASEAVALPAATSPADVTAPSAETSATAPAAPVIANARITGVRKVRLSGGERNVVRSGPGDTFSISGVYPGGAEFKVIAKSGPWYNIRLSDNETAWIHASLCREFDDLSDLEFRPNKKIYSRTGSFIVAGYAGGYAFDRKSNSLVLGSRLGYYVFDRLQVEAGVSWTSVNRPAEIVESLFGLTLEAEKFPMLFYQMNVVWELLPGRQMVPYLGAGVGSTLLLGRSESTVNYGAGMKLFLSKRTAMRWEVRDYRFHNHTSSDNGINNNIEFTLGSEVLF